MKRFFALFLFAHAVCFAEPAWVKAQNLEVLVSKEEIAKKITDVAAKIDAAYQGQDLQVLIVMKGGVCTASDLIRALQTPITLGYMKASSYGQNGAHAGELKITGLEELDLSGKNVLVVDDIFDSGNTMTALMKKLEERKPKSLKSLVLLSKKIARTTEYRPDYVLFEIENRFVVGYGLDYKEHYRGLDSIYAFINDTPPASLP